MAKILLLILIVWVVYTLIKRYQRSLNVPQPGPKPAEDMVKCAHCAVNLPRSEALLTKGEFFCTPEHLQLGRK